MTDETSSKGLTPEENPFACNICGGSLTSRERIVEDGVCDDCKREHGSWD